MSRLQKGAQSLRAQFESTVGVAATPCQTTEKTRLKLKGSWLPIVDAFRTFTACPTPAIISVFQQIQGLSV